MLGEIRCMKYKNTCNYKLATTKRMNTTKMLKSLGNVTDMVIIGNVDKKTIRTLADNGQETEQITQK